MKHFSDYVNIALAVHGLALAIVNLTPTPKDDEALGTARTLVVKFYKVIELLALVGPLAKR